MNDLETMRLALAALEAILTPCPPLTHEVGSDGECPACPVERQALAAIAALKAHITLLEEKALAEKGQ